MALKHFSDKLQKKLADEVVKVKHHNVRFTVTHYNAKGKLLGREWYKGDLAITPKRMALASDGVKFLNIKKGDERFSAARFEEDNAACLEVKYAKEPDSKRCLVIHIYTPKVQKFLKLLAGF